MIEDIRIKTGGEIVMSKEGVIAIGTRTVRLYEEYIGSLMTKGKSLK